MYVFDQALTATAMRDGSSDCSIAAKTAIEIQVRHFNKQLAGVNGDDAIEQIL